MNKKLYHHLSDGTFRNPEGSPTRSGKVKFSYRQFTKEKKKLMKFYQFETIKLINEKVFIFVIF